MTHSWRVLWSFARPHVRTLACGLLLALVGSALALATPMVTKWVLDSLGAGTPLAVPVGALLALLVLGAVVGRRQWVMLGALGGAGGPGGARLRGAALPEGHGARRHPPPGG